MKHDRKAWKKGPAQKSPVDSWQLEQPSPEPGARAGREWDHLGVWQGRFPFHGRPGVGSVGMSYKALALAFMFVSKFPDGLELIWRSSTIASIVSDHVHKFQWFPAPIAILGDWYEFFWETNSEAVCFSGDLGLDNLNPNQAMSFVDSYFPKKSSPLTLCSECHLTAGLNNEHATDKMDEMWAVSVWRPASPNSYPWFQEINSAGS